MKKKIAASFLGAKNAGRALKTLNVTDIDYIHVDVMDGKYVKHKTMPFSELSTITYYTEKRLDVHLMVIKPLKWIDKLASLNVDCISVHLDIKDDIEKVIERCKLYGIKIGIALNPEQDISLVYPYLDKIHKVLIMSVNPGKSGQDFILESINKVNTLRKEIEKRKLKTLIEIDGGVNFLNIKDLTNADIIVSGSTILKSDNFQDTIAKLRKCVSK
ncbi:MAG: ribulose-phosphate 3-epimerase [Bacilli bacterium]|nr:ribulose-phosphate 3-epimerase [Bacilli bacterium]